MYVKSVKYAMSLESKQGHPYQHECVKLNGYTVIRKYERDESDFFFLDFLKFLFNWAESLYDCCKVWIWLSS